MVWNNFSPITDISSYPMNIHGKVKLCDSFCESSSIWRNGKWSEPFLYNIYNETPLLRISIRSHKLGKRMWYLEERAAETDFLQQREEATILLLKKSIKDSSWYKATILKSNNTIRQQYFCWKRALRIPVDITGYRKVAFYFWWKTHRTWSFW